MLPPYPQTIAATAMVAHLCVPPLVVFRPQRQATWLPAARCCCSREHTCGIGRVPGAGPGWKLSSLLKPLGAATLLCTDKGSVPCSRAGTPTCSHRPPRSHLQVPQLAGSRVAPLSHPELLPHLCQPSAAAHGSQQRVVLNIPLALNTTKPVSCTV